MKHLRQLARGLGIAIAIVTLSACAPATPDTGRSETFEGLSDGWNRIPGGAESSCAYGTEYSFWFKPSETEKVAIYFQGGGACWMGEMCALDRSPTYDPFVDESDIPPSTGIFDFKSAENPIKDWSVLFVPYCTADVHVGNSKQEYNFAANDSLPAGTVEIRHWGSRNTNAALEWLYERISDPAKILVTGVSAGSIGSAVYAHEIAERFPKADVVQLGDASGGYRVPSVVPSLLSAWGAVETLERSTRQTPDSWSFESVYLSDNLREPNLRMAQINYHEDEVQRYFLTLMGQRGIRLMDLLEANLSEIGAGSSEFSSYLIPGSDHGIIREDQFYEVMVDGVRLRDWTADLISGETLESVDCGVCR